MILSDNDIRYRISGYGKYSNTPIAVKQEQLVIDPLEPGQIQPASVDLTLGDEFTWGKELEYEGQLPRYVLQPGELALGTTVERVKMPLDLVGQVDGKSTLGRLGLIVHVTAGYIDPGFEGQITLEFVNLSRVAIRLTPGMRICQLVLHQMLSPASAPYGDPKFRSHYQGQTGVTKSHGLEDLR